MKNTIQSLIVARSIVAGLLFGAVFFIENARASLVYDSGPYLSTANGANLQESWSDEFFLSSSTPLAQAQITVYSPEAITQPVSLIWAITPAANYPVLSSGNASLNLTSLGTLGGDNLYQASFALSGNFAAGSYFLTLTNANAPIFWQFCNDNGSVASLQLYDTSAVPEPAVYPWFAGSMAVLTGGVLVRCKRKTQRLKV